MELDQKTVYDRGNQYTNAMAMGEMIWQKKSVRRNNIQNSYKDKEALDE